jgi:hypothetical protein
VWRRLADKKPSIRTFNFMFNDKELRHHLKVVFKSRYLIREIIRSGISIDLKKIYISYVDVLKKGFI